MSFKEFQQHPRLFLDGICGGIHTIDETTGHQAVLVAAGGAMPGTWYTTPHSPASTANQNQYLIPGTNEYHRGQGSRGGDKWA